MKTLTLAFTFSALVIAAGRPIELKTQQVPEGGPIHWMPEKVEVKQGETVEFQLRHDVPGGFDFHGFFVPVLKIAEQVNRTTDPKTKKELPPKKVEKKIPSDLKPGEYEIGCQFHPKHVSAKLVVTPAK